MRIVFTGMILWTSQISAQSEEIILASYFDIPVNSPAGTEVTGRIHLERNKDVRYVPIPEGYHFVIIRQDPAVFRIETRCDPQGRMMGVFVVGKDQQTGPQPGRYKLSIALKNDNRLLNEFTVKIDNVTETLWTTLHRRYKDHTISSKGNRMYGRRKFSDEEVEQRITELEAGNGRFPGFHCYDWLPEDYPGSGKSHPEFSPSKAGIEVEWEEVASLIGGLGYAYAKSQKFGPTANEADRTRLKKALYDAILAYTRCVPVEGDDVFINGSPAGPYTGDGFIRLSENGLISHALATHHWRILDPLVAPAVHLMPDLLEDINKGDRQASAVHEAMIRYYQLAMSLISSRRAIDDPSQRWGEIIDTLYSEGAWADANLGHRSRVLLALPIIWADYNRPMTYVPYWYSDFYGGKPYHGFSLSPGWSPHGVVPDLHHWLTRFCIPAHQYKQSGFHPDGTVSHHIGHGTDAALLAYGFAWLTEGFTGLHMFRDTPYQLNDRFYQFPADRMLHVYGKLMYKGQMDFTISGRSFLSDMDDFREKTFLPAMDVLFEAKGSDTRINNEDELNSLKLAINNGTHEYTGTQAYWIPAFLAHRRGENEDPYYASVKLKSEKVIGAEDFGMVRRSWHAGSGVLQLRVSGKEYTHEVLGNMDWHMLPGITEEWRTDPLPAEGGAAASLPGLNQVSGVLADGKNGMAIYHHLPGETYSSASALKSYYFLDKKVIALGSEIDRFREGQQKGIHTCIDQSAMGEADLVYFIGGKKGRIASDESVDLRFQIQEPVWLHHHLKGYLVFPAAEQELVIKTGEKINITDPNIASGEPNYLLAMDHGISPAVSGGNQYQYILIPNVEVNEMPVLMNRIKHEVKVRILEDSIHSVFSESDRVTQVAFFKKGKICTGNNLVIDSNAPAMVMLSEQDEYWTISVSDPTADINLESMTIKISIPLQDGRYDYEMPGIYPRPGEYASVTSHGSGSTIVIELPDRRDAVHYQYQEALYAGAPVVLSIPKKN